MGGAKSKKQTPNFERSNSKEPSQISKYFHSKRMSRRQRASSISRGVKQLQHEIESFDGDLDDPRYNEYRTILKESSQEIQDLKRKSKPVMRMFLHELEQVVSKNERDLDSRAVKPHSFIDQTPNMKKRERECSEERVAASSERPETQSERSDESGQDQPWKASRKYSQPATGLDQVEQNAEELLKEINSAIELDDTKQFVALEERIRLVCTDLETIEVEEHTPLHARKENISRNLTKCNNRIKKAKSNSASHRAMVSEEEERLRIQAELQVIVPVQRELEDLQVKVLTFDGVKGDEYYKELDRALKSNWTKIEGLEASSETIRKMKQEAVALIKKTLQDLKRKSEENAGKMKTVNENTASIREDALVLGRSAEDFNESRSDPEYKDLDEKLRSLWAKLNDVHRTSEKVGAYKKETIDLIEQMLRTLLQDAQHNEHIAGADDVDQDNTRAFEVLSVRNFKETRSDPKHKDLGQKLPSLWINDADEKVEVRDLIRHMSQTLIQDAQYTEHIADDGDQDNAKALEAPFGQNHDFLMQTKEFQLHWNTINKSNLEKLSLANKEENVVQELKKKKKSLSRIPAEQQVIDLIQRKLEDGDEELDNTLKSIDIHTQNNEHVSDDIDDEDDNTRAYEENYDFLMQTNELKYSDDEKDSDQVLEEKTKSLSRTRTELQVIDSIQCKLEDLKGIKGDDTARALKSIIQNAQQDNEHVADNVEVNIDEDNTRAYEENYDFLMQTKELQHSDDENDGVQMLEKTKSLNKQQIIDPIQPNLEDLQVKLLTFDGVKGDELDNTQKRIENAQNNEHAVDDVEQDNTRVLEALMEEKFDFLVQADKKDVVQVLKTIKNLYRKRAVVEVLISVQRDLEDLQVKVLTFDGLKGDENYKELERGLKYNRMKMQDLETSSEAHRRQKLKIVDLIEKVLQELDSKSEENRLAQSAQKLEN